MKLIVQKIEEVSGKKARFDTYLKQEYLMGSNVTEDHLLEVGFNKISFEDISFSLSNPTQKVQFMVAEPQGLYLKEVKY